MPKRRVREIAETNFFTAADTFKSWALRDGLSPRQGLVEALEAHLENVHDMAGSEGFNDEEYEETIDRYNDLVTTNAAHLLTDQELAGLGLDRDTPVFYPPVERFRIDLDD